MRESITAVQDSFIKKYITKVDPAFVSIYIYLLWYLKDGGGIMPESLASVFNRPVSDVALALEFWKEEDLVSYDEEKKAFYIKQPCAVKPPSYSKKPEYSPEEVAVYIQKSKAVGELFSFAQAALAKPLNHREISLIYSFYDWLRLPAQVIKLLISYCAENGHTDLRYMEKVAVSWAEEGIETVDDANAKIFTYNKIYKDITAAMGQRGRMPAPAEERYIKKWLNEYGHSSEIICLACEKTLIAAGKPSYPYAESILKDWFKSGIKTIQDVKRMDEEYLASKSAPVKDTEKKKKNKFINFEQRDWDFEEIERLQLEQLNK
ncbi:MAG: DnaD domain protein [Lachnospiraceae bacterium]|nr:DnaD domain protein [Lachnospiraceae bacterium]